MFRRFAIMAVLLWAGTAWAVPDKAPGLEQVLNGIENRYAGRGFTADFFQESILKAMQITDTAEGRLIVQRPDKMRWEYIIPDTQIIITDGQSMWIYRPDDKQVMVGPAPEFFGGGKGAGFLSDIRQIRKSFKVQLQEAQNDAYHRLHLTPLKPMPELAQVILSVSKADFRIDQVITFNAYGDETRIVLSDYRFDIDPDEALFDFKVPEGVDVVPLDAP
jgi:outer membrane lipoprotein carrier protein